MRAHTARARRPSEAVPWVLRVGVDDRAASTIDAVARASGWCIRAARDGGSVANTLVTAPHLVVTALALVDGSGLNVVRLARGRSRPIPTLVVADAVDADAFDEAQLLGARVACDRTRPDRLRAFIEQLMALRPRSVEGAVAEIGAPWRLTRAEERVLVAAAEGGTREMIAATLGVSVNTLKTHVRSILVKSGADSLDQAVAPVRAAVLRP